MLKCGLNDLSRACVCLQKQCCEDELLTRLKDQKKSHLSTMMHFRKKTRLAKLPLSKIITKVDQFDSSLGRQEDVVAFDVTMDNPVVVQMLEPLSS